MFFNSDEPKILTESEIMELKKQHGIVLFYMNGCGHCETMKPAWNKLINELKDKHKNEIILGAIESGSMDMFKKHGISPSVSGFPTILYFHPNKLSTPESYKGDRSYEDLKKWLLSKKGKGKGKSNDTLVILTDYKNNNNAQKKNLAGMGMGKKKGFEFPQSGGGTRRRRMRINRKSRSHSRRKMSMRKNTRRRYRR
jgi:hypothetical protein